MFYAIFKRRKLTDENMIKDFEIKFGTFFSDFKPNGIKMWIFYVFYISRRTLLIASFLCKWDSGLQLGIALGFCLSVITI